MKYLYDDISISKIKFEVNGLSKYNDVIEKMILNIGQRSLVIIVKDENYKNEIQKEVLINNHYIFCEGYDETKYTLKWVIGSDEISNGCYFVFQEIIENTFLTESNIKTDYVLDEFNLYEGTIAKHFEDHIRNMEFKYESENIKIKVEKDKDSNGIVKVFIEKKSEVKQFEEKVITRIIELMFLYLGAMPERIRTTIHINGNNVNIYTNTRPIFSFRSTSKNDVILCDVNEDTINEKILKNFENILNEDKLPFPLFLHSLSETESDVRLSDLVECIDGLYQIDNARAKANSNGTAVRTDKSLDRRIAHYIDKGACEPNKITPVIFEKDINKDQNLNTELANIRHLYRHQVAQDKEKMKTDSQLPLDKYNYYEQKLVLCLRVAYLELIGIDINKETQNKISKIVEQIETDQDLYKALKNMNKPKNQ